MVDKLTGFEVAIGAVNVWCKWCRRWHTHEMKDGVVPAGCHASTPYSQDGYEIVCTSGKPPALWTSGDGFYGDRPPTKDEFEAKDQIRLPCRKAEFEDLPKALVKMIRKADESWKPFRATVVESNMYSLNGKPGKMIKSVAARSNGFAVWYHNGSFEGAWFEGRLTASEAAKLIALPFPCQM